MYYVMHLCGDGIKRKLYFSKEMNSAYCVLGMYNSLCMENDERSPHRYTGNINLWNIRQGCMLADIGAQEGMLGLHHISLIDKLYIFECDEYWVDALKATFAEYMDKVVIVPKYVGNMDDDDYIRLDTFFENKEINLVKMDIEGAEIMALQGAEKLLKKKEIEWAICSYHNADDEHKIIDVYKSNKMKYDISPGLVYIKNFGPRGLRHAIVWGKHAQ